MQTLATSLVVLGLLVAAGIGIYLGLKTLGDAISDDNVAAVATNTPGNETPAPTDTAGNTFTPAPSVAADARGTLRRADRIAIHLLAASDYLAGEGSLLEAKDVNTDVKGCATTPVSVTLSKGGGDMHLATLFYDSAAAAGQDWNLGAQVTPKDGRSIPGDAVVWYNANVVVVVLDQDPAVKPDAFDGLIALGS